MKPPPTVPRRPYFFSRATVEILLCALAEAENATPKPDAPKRPDTGYSMVRR